MSKSPKEAAIDILARRDHSIYEMRMKLKKKGVSQGDIEEVIVWLQQKRLLDDRKFAQTKAESIMRTKAVGPQYIYNKLREARIDSVSIEYVVENLCSREEWDTRAKKAVEQWKKIHPKHAGDRVRIMRFLVSRGFTSREVA